LFVASLVYADEVVDESPASAPEQEEESADKMGPRARWLKSAEKVLEESIEKRQTGERRRRLPWFMDDELLARAGIGQEQAVEIRRVIADTEAEMQALRLETGTEAGTTMRNLIRILLSDDFSEERATELLDQILEQRNVLVRSQMVPKIKVRALLSTSQIAAIRAERPSFFMEPHAIPAVSEELSKSES